MTELLEEVRDLKRRLDDLARHAADGPARSDVTRKLAAAIRMTQELFPGDVVVEVDCDPEAPDDSFVVFNVQSSGDAKTLVDRQCEWHRRVSSLTADFEGLRLSILPCP